MCLVMKWEPSWMGLQPQQEQFAVVCSLGGTHNSRQLQRLVKQFQSRSDKDSSICTSTAYEGYERTHMCLTVMWEPSWFGLQPQQSHFIIVCPSGGIHDWMSLQSHKEKQGVFSVRPSRGTQTSRQLPKAWPTELAVMQQWWKTVHVFGYEVGAILDVDGSVASTRVICSCQAIRRYPELQSIIPKACDKDLSICASTLYEVYETPHMCLTMKCEPSWMGIQSQQPHFPIVCFSGGTRDSRYFSNACSTRLAVT